MALVLGVVALVEALVPVPRGRGLAPAPQAAPALPSPAPVRSLELRYPAGRARPRQVRVPTGAHVTIQVTTSVAGQAVISRLGLVQPADPGTPARFDLLATTPGAYDVSFEPAAGGTATVGRIVVAARG
jgi:hypothetical protein